MRAFSILEIRLLCIAAPCDFLGDSLARPHPHSTAPPSRADANVEYSAPDGRSRLRTSCAAVIANGSPSVSRPAASVRPAASCAADAPRRARASVMCARSSAAQPSRSNSRLSLAANVCKPSRSPASPSQSTRGRRPPNTPAPSNASSSGGEPAAARRIAAVAAGARSLGASPRKRSVRCSASGRAQRQPPGSSARSRASAAAAACCAAVGSWAAINRRSAGLDANGSGSRLTFRPPGAIMAAADWTPVGARLALRR